MKIIKYTSGALIILLLLMITAYAGFRIAFKGLVFPRVGIAGIDLTGVDRDTSLKIITTAFSSDKNEIILISEGQEVANLNNIQIERDFEWATDQAFNVGRNGNILTKLSEQLDTIFNGRNIDIPLKYDQEELSGFIDEVSISTNIEPIWPKLEIVRNEIVFVEGKNGVLVNKDDLKSNIIKTLALPGSHKLQVPVILVDTKEDPAVVTTVKSSMEKWRTATARIGYRDFEKKLSQDELLSLFDLTDSGINDDRFKNLVDEIKDKIETEPRDAVFIFEEERVKEFEPEVIGATIDIPSFKNKLAEYLFVAEDSIFEVPVILSYPDVRTGDINNLGIKELIGSGKSTFLHSIPGRVFNVALASNRINGVLVPPGEEFSFNEAVGEISKSTGYQTAYIISGGRTVLGDGGGVCQVSTTVFRAILDAGLPVTQRRAHAYRVGYYEQDSAPGIDATIFSPSVDLKFLNDTGNHILVQTTVDTKNMTLRVDFYGTKDGRVATISKPSINSQTPPPPTLYVDDPTLPLGQTKQIDWAAWGAKVSFDYKVEKDGEVMIEKTFYSNYQPWQAIYLKGTGDLAGR